MRLRKLISKSDLLRKIIARTLPARLKFALGLFPVSLGKERKRLNEVLSSGSWNMSYGPTPAHLKLEKVFAEYIGSSEAVAVSGGGVGIQMSIRALGLGRESEVLMQIDTCSAVPMAALNSQVIPRFFDADINTFLSNPDSVKSKIGQNTQAVIASHLWGNSDDLKTLSNLGGNSEVVLIEDCCLALGTEFGGKKVGTTGKVGIFSFGSTKPVQAGEGGIIVTDDLDLARELRAMRNWGERTKEFGIRDVNDLSWNGRISEFSAAVAIEQVRNFPSILNAIRENVAVFDKFLNENTLNMEINLGNSTSLSDPSFSQVVLKLNGFSEKSKVGLLQHLADCKITAFHANFEPISTLSLFKSGDWTKWMNNPQWSTKMEMQESQYPNSFEIFRQKGIGLSRTNFQSKYTTRRLISALESFSA
jgi:dTDP-4-amino-4,6-dideoxygalactose transaminase